MTTPATVPLGSAPASQVLGAYSATPVYQDMLHSVHKDAGKVLHMHAGISMHAYTHIVTD